MDPCSWAGTVGHGGLFYYILLWIPLDGWAGTVWNMQGLGPSFFFFFVFTARNFLFCPLFLSFVKLRSVMAPLYSAYSILFCVASCDGFFPYCPCWVFQVYWSLVLYIHGIIFGLSFRGWVLWGDIDDQAGGHAYILTNRVCYFFHKSFNLRISTSFLCGGIWGRTRDCGVLKFLGYISFGIQNV